jgi:hypothetical protein
MLNLTVPSGVAAIAPDGQLSPAQRRHIMIEICRRRIHPGSGSAPEFLRRRTAMISWPDLRPVLQGVAWAITGAVATRAYMPERLTRDLDILVRRQDESLVKERLAAAGYALGSALAIGGFVAYSLEGTEIDVILGDYGWLDEALACVREDQAGFPVLDLPYLVLAKLAASRAQDIGDLSRMLGFASDEELARVREVVARRAPAEMDDLESLIYLGRLERGERPG